jgi:hypothetical protein
MLTRPQVQRYANRSGLRDLAIAETEIVLTFLLQLFAERGFLDNLAFKGGTCLRKMFIGTQGRFSTDLDFTATQDHEPDDMILLMMEAFETAFHGITFAIDLEAYYETQDGLSWGGPTAMTGTHPVRARSSCRSAAAKPRHWQHKPIRNACKATSRTCPSHRPR